MSEILNTYKLDDPETVEPMDRDEFYAEQIAVFKKTGKPTRAAEIVSILIFNEHQELLIQKRSYNKTHNAGLLDKSIGGHVQYGDAPDYTVMVESVQELQTPSIVLKNEVDFNKTFTLLADYLTTIAVIKHNKSKIHILERMVKGEKIKMANKVHLYFGIYHGSIRPVDREAKGILYYTLEELEKEMKEFPETFSQDLHFFIKEFHADIVDFIKKIVPKK
ncbi:MAG: NUDIX domain-containing protein [Candidatus Komeilibacteria bacterium]|nr:NUDIX domain-containing protein [Candidatus Komeilibacteria bacterium]